MPEYRVHFEVFEGPLDLLLHLVKKQEVDIYEINLTQVATEFVAYLNQMRELDLEVAGEFLVMAATLLFIKSRELLPKEQRASVAEDEADEDDPRFELIRRLVEYKKFKDAAAQLQEREGEMADTYERRPVKVALAPVVEARAEPATVWDLVHVVSEILKRFGAREDVRRIEADPYTVSEKMEYLRQLVTTRASFRVSELFEAAHSRTEVVVTFLAILELTRLKQFVLTQGEEFGEIDVSPVPPPPPPEPELPGLGAPDPDRSSEAEAAGAPETPASEPARPA